MAEESEVKERVLQAQGNVIVSLSMHVNFKAEIDVRENESGVLLTPMTDSPTMCAAAVMVDQRVDSNRLGKIALVDAARRLLAKLEAELAKDTMVDSVVELDKSKSNGEDVN